ncbi:MAG: gluconate 2-dehydrogenase subunit 3 family protein [Aquimonas sp.]|nr:gluconate 2-dehydrogenase subunit 3 family protein [Aquimonas sp.]
MGAQDAPFTGLAANRRQLFAGLLSVATLAQLPLLGSCSAPEQNLEFFSQEQLRFISALVDTLIPATDTPGALAAEVDVNLGKFLGHWASQETALHLRNAVSDLHRRLDEHAGSDFVAAGAQTRTMALSAIDQMAFAQPSDERWDGYRTLKEISLRLYYTSKIGATQELRYDPVPGGFIGDFPLADAGRNWAT